MKLLRYTCRSRPPPRSRLAAGSSIAQATVPRAAQDVAGDSRPATDGGHGSNAWSQSWPPAPAVPTAVPVGARPRGRHGGLFGGNPPQPSRCSRAASSGTSSTKKKPQLPVFQAAPWYNYWPYDGHFLTPAPIGGAFYGPPLTGNFPVNPYFPGPAGAVGN